MAILKGSKILASDWNDYIEGLDYKLFLSLESKDKIGDNSVSADGYFWNRNSGFHWGNFYESSKDYGTFKEGTVLTIYEDISKVSLEALVDTTEVPSVSSTDWKIIRYDYSYSTVHSIAIGDEIVFSGGLFKSLTGVTAKPLLPNWSVSGDILSRNSDANFELLSKNNFIAYERYAGFRPSINIYLVNPETGDQFSVFTFDPLLNSASDVSYSFWIPPGYFYYTASLEDTGSPTWRRGKIHLSCKTYDGNVKQGKPLRKFKGDFSDLFVKGNTLILAQDALVSKAYTDEDILEKGGTPSEFGGDW